MKIESKGTAGGKEQKRPAEPVEPSYMQEFREISSQYEIEDKEDSVAISSNGEFAKADKMAVYEENDTEVLRID